MKALAVKPLSHLIEHRLFAAEEVDAAGDVEKEPVLSAQRDQRRIAVAPVGKAFQKPAIGLRLRLDHLQPGMHGARVGHPHARAQPEGGGRLVEGCDALRVVLAVADGERLAGACALTPRL